MRYICAECNEEILKLRSNGDEECKDLICPECSLKISKDIARQFVELQEQINRFFHSR